MGRGTLRLILGLLLAGSLALSPMVMGVQRAAAQAVLVVDDDGFATAADCDAATPAFPTIGAAVAAASPGDTIKVCPGVYPELAPGPLTINKTLTLLGAQSGVDARGRVGAESIVTDSQGTFVTANNVVIDGFTIQNSTNPAFTGFGIAMGAGTTGTQILNDIIQNNIVGIGLANSGASKRSSGTTRSRTTTKPGARPGAGSTPTSS